jgi:hypothetical protein
MHEWSLTAGSCCYKCHKVDPTRRAIPAQLERWDGASISDVYSQLHDEGTRRSDGGGPDGRARQAGSARRRGNRRVIFSDGGTRHLLVSLSILTTYRLVGILNV